MHMYVHIYVQMHMICSHNRDGGPFKASTRISHCGYFPSFPTTVAIYLAMKKPTKEEDVKLGKEIKLFMWSQGKG